MKVLALDIETSPHVVYRWGELYKPQATSISMVVSTTEVMCFSAKWIGDDKGTYPGAQRPKKDGTVFYGGLKNDRLEMVLAAHDLLGQADVILHFNGKNFDIPHLNREFLEHGLTPPPPYGQVDLMKAAQKSFKFGSNRLQHLLDELGLARKLETGGPDLWRRCLAGDEVAWRQMERYNRQDVTVMEDLYLLLRPWITQHPNVALHDGIAGLACPRCGSTDSHRRGYRYTGTGKYARHQCNQCAGFFRSRAAESTSGSAEIAA